MVVVEPGHAENLSWSAIRREAADLSAIVSLIEVSNTNARWLVPAVPASVAARQVAAISAAVPAAAGAAAAVIDKLFEAQASVPTISACEVRLFASGRLEEELSAELGTETRVRLRVFDKIAYRPACDAKAEPLPIKWSNHEDTSRPTLQLLSRGRQWQPTRLPVWVAKLNLHAFHKGPDSSWRPYAGRLSTRGIKALDRYGRLWNIADEHLSARPLESFVPGLPALRDVALTPWGGHGIGLGGSVWAWGSGTQSRLGRRGQRDTPHPIKIDVDNAVRVFAADFTCYVIKRDGQIYSWGSNDHFALGRRHPSSWTHHVNLVPGVSGAVEIVPWKFSGAGGVRGVLARTISGQLYAWGEAPPRYSWWSNGYLAPRPLDMPRGPQIVRVSCDGEAIHAIGNDGSLFRWARIDGPPEHIYPAHRWLQFDGHLGLDDTCRIWRVNKVGSLELVIQLPSGSEYEVVGFNDDRIWILQRKRT
ncbi:RCC1 domain-containing protein [Sinomonas soli]